MTLHVTLATSRFSADPMASPAPSDQTHDATSDTFVFDGAMSNVEIVWGFRPGLDRIVIVESGAQVAAAIAADGFDNTVIPCAAGRMIVLEGIAPDEVEDGDIVRVLVS